jgi:GNAT superfamily N-acetyltransferase
MLDPLPPDIRFERLLPNPADLAFSFAAKKEALGPHIRARWPWDEDSRALPERPFFRIWRQSDAVGTLSWLVGDDHARFGEFYLFPQYQGAGLWTRILRHALTIADERRLPVRLEYLKWNPVGGLYLRCGFVRTHETDIHVFLERPANRTREQ